MRKRRSVTLASLLISGSLFLAERAPADEAQMRQLGTFRYVSVGLVNPRSSASTYRLFREGPRARIVLESQVHGGSMSIQGGWVSDGGSTYVGSARDSGGALLLDVSDGATRLDLACSWKREQVAVATAVRVRTGPGGDCGDRGAWSPAATSAMVFACSPVPATPPVSSPPPPTDPAEARWERAVAAEQALRAQLSFGSGAGVEYLYVNDDCVMQGGGLRFIPPDRSIAEARGSGTPPP
jgi:hypothetical protein